MLKKPLERVEICRVVKEANVPAILQMFALFDAENLSVYEGYFRADPSNVWGAIIYARSKPSSRYDYIDTVAAHKVVDATDEGYRVMRDDGATEVLQAAFAQAPETLQLPEWCLIYLTRCAKEIADLFADVGPSEYDRGLTVKAAAAKLPQIFGFVQRGRSVFLDFLRARRNEELVSKFEELLEDGLSKARAKRAILENSDIQDERTLQRLLARPFGGGGKT